MSRHSSEDMGCPRDGAFAPDDACADAFSGALAARASAGGRGETYRSVLAPSIGSAEGNNQTATPRRSIAAVDARGFTTCTWCRVLALPGILTSSRRASRPSSTSRSRARRGHAGEIVASSAARSPRDPHTSSFRPYFGPDAEGHWSGHSRRHATLHGPNPRTRRRSSGDRLLGGGPSPGHRSSTAARSTSRPTGRLRGRRTAPPSRAPLHGDPGDIRDPVLMAMMAIKGIYAEYACIAQQRHRLSTRPRSRSAAAP